MLGALATTFLFALTPVLANRAAGLLGSLRANFWRLCVAAVLLGAWAHVVGRGLGGASLPWFVLGGVVGFGLGGVAMFQSLPRLGANLSTLIVQCVSAIVAVALEWAWLGTPVSALQGFCITLTLAGVAVGLLPQSLPRVPPQQWAAGLAWAVTSAIGQGAGVVISRKAFAVAAQHQTLIDPGTAAYQRVLGGLAIAALTILWLRIRRTATPAGARAATPWVCANALTGPVLGVTCYQWALRSTPAGIVQPIVAAAPLLTIPFATWLEGGRPRAPYYAGALLAVLGVAGLMVWR